MEKRGKEDIRSWCHDWPPSFAASGQESRLTGTIYYGDKKRWQLPALVRSIRGRSVVEVVEVFLLAPRKGRADVRRRGLQKTVEEITAPAPAGKGAIIRELNTGHTSLHNLPSMMTRAVEMIGRSGRGIRSAVNGRASKGRPDKYTREQRASQREIWFSREYATAMQAVAAMQALGMTDVKRTYCYNKFGPRNPRVADDI